MTSNQVRAAWRGTGKGSALVEFALILPAILLLVVGMFEFARAWNLHSGDDRCSPRRARGVANSVMDQDSASGHGVNGTVRQGPRLLQRHVGHHDYAYRQQAVGANITIQLSLPYRFFILPGMSITMRTAFTMRNE